MKGKWLLWARKTHLFLGVFYAPLLLMFIITGWWQTAASDEEKERQGGYMHTLMQKFSSVHTDDYYPHAGAGGHSHLPGKILVVTMSLSLIISILLGLVLAWQMTKKKSLVVIAFVLGIVVPPLLFYFW